MADVAIWLAYLAIPLVLFLLVRRRQDFPFRGLFVLFGAFIVSCGFTHLMEAVTAYVPIYRFSGLLKVATALISWATVAALIPVVPRLLSLRTPEDLLREIEERTQELSNTVRKLQKEVEERRRTETALRQSEETLERRVAERSAALEEKASLLRNQARLLESILNSMAEGVVVTDENGRMLLFNPAGERIVGMGKTDFPSERWSEVYHLFLPDGKSPFPPGELPLTRAIRGEPTDDVELVVHRSEWSRGVLLSATGRPLLADDGEIKGGVIVFRDITARKQAEQQVRTSLAEKNILLKEIHHRVKNNLQVISSLLDLQSRYTQDEHSASMFKESNNRVRSMAMVHERLYRSADMVKVDFADYIRNLTHHLFAAYRIDTDRVQLATDVRDIWLSIDAAVPCGLIVNELISNCLKHAFRERERGSICIEFVPLNDSEVMLRVSDDGVGLPAAMDPRAAESFGLQLVADLTDQLHGTVQVQRGAGTTFKIVFPYHPAGVS